MLVILLGFWGLFSVVRDIFSGDLFWILVGGVVYDADGAWSGFFPLVLTVSGVGPFVSGIFGTHMWRPQGERAGVSPPPVVLTAFLAWAISRVRFSLCISFVHISYL